MAKRKLSKEEIEDRAGAGRNGATHGCGVAAAPPFQAEIASLVDGQITPAELRHIIALAWSPHTPRPCRTSSPKPVTIPARTGWSAPRWRPEPSGTTSWASHPNKAAGRNGLGDKLHVWVSFNTAFLKAQQRGKVVKAAAMSDFVKQHGRSQPWPVNTVAALRKILGQVERATSQEFRDGLMFPYSKP